MKKSILSALALSVVVSGAVAYAAPANAETSNPVIPTVRYEVTVHTNWSDETHPGYFPKNGGIFSPVVASTHNDMYMPWEIGQKASEALEVQAESGNPSYLYNEAVLKAFSAFKGMGPIKAVGTYTFVIEANAENPYLSLSSMIAPSPDWLVGTRIRLYDDNKNVWSEGMQELTSFDAGTEDGRTFSTENEPTNPIRRVVKAPGQLQGMGYVTYTLIK